MSNFVLVLHLAATAYMTGIIWFVQVAHYPYFHEVPPERFTAYHQRYTRQMGLLVGPVMLVELATGLSLLVQHPRPVFLLNFLGLVLLWASTFLLQVPCHNRLGSGYHAALHLRLVRTNWIRTLIWTARLILLIATLYA